MSFLGIHLARSDDLVTHLTNWRHQSDQVIDLVVQAETLSEVPTNARTLLDEIGDDGVQLAAVIRRAARDIAQFRLPVLHHAGIELPVASRLSANERALAVAAGERILVAQADGRVPDRRDFDDLQRTFYRAIADPNVAAAGFRLAMQGYPLEKSLLVHSQRNIARVYDPVVDAIVQGQTPTQAGLAAGLFPPGYRTRSGGFDVTRFEATRAVADWAGPTGAEWFGHALSPIFDSGTTAQVAETGRLLAGDLRLATGFMNERGASGVASIPSALMRRNEPALLDSLANYSAALALATHSGALEFDGADLIQANADRRATGVGAAGIGGAAERMLLAPGFDQGFLVQAIAWSFESRGELVASWSGLPDFLAAQLIDPRSVAAQAAVDANLAGQVVHALGDQAQLGALIEPTQPFVGDDPALVALNGVAPVAALLTLAGQDHRASTQVVQYLYDRGGYLSIPLGADLPDRAQPIVTAHRTINDERIAAGVSGLLVEAAPAFIRASGTDLGVDDYVAMQLASPFMGAYHTVLVSGSGAHLGFMSESILDRSIRAHLESGAQTLGAERAAMFLGTAQGVRYATQLGDAELTDAAADDLSRTLGIFGLATGLVGAPGAKVVSTAASGASLLTGSDNTALELSKEQLTHVLGQSTNVRRAALVALFGSGVVQTAAGAVVGLRPAGSGFRIIDDDNNEIRLDESPGDNPYQFDTLPAGYTASAAFADLQVNGVPLAAVLASVESVDTTLHNAHAATEKQLSDN